MSKDTVRPSPGMTTQERHQAIVSGLDQVQSYVSRLNMVRKTPAAPPNFLDVVLNTEERIQLMNTLLNTATHLYLRITEDKERDITLPEC